jgi:hypothetical protein
MVEDVPTQPDLELQIVALLRYVDSCRSAPTPHSDCPLAASVTPLPAGCLSECQETLSGLLRRGRAVARTGSDFDAGRIRLSDEGAPNVAWHVSSLIQEVVKAARSFPYTRAGELHLKRWVYGTSALGALGYRGLDPEALLRYGLGNYVKIGLSTWLEWADEESEAAKGWPNYESWRSLFESETGASQDSGRYLSAAFTGSVDRKLDAWLATAPLEDILRWTPPAEDVTTSRRPAAEIELWTWLVERFTRTYLDSWSMESLKQEYLRLKGEFRPAVPEDVLAERTIQPASLAYQIAELAVRRHSKIDQGVLGALTEQAVELLRDGQRRAAAALFDGARILSPGDFSVLNNYERSVSSRIRREGLRPSRHSLQLGVGGIFAKPHGSFFRLLRSGSGTAQWQCVPVAEERYWRVGRGDDFPSPVGAGVCCRCGDGEWDAWNLESAPDR